MFTVCPKCALTLVVTAEDLRVAQGYVRCGRCSSVFNALARLTEQQLAREGTVGPAEPTPPESAREPAPPASPALTPAPEALSPPQGAADEDAIPEAALEFDPSKTDVSSVFVEPPPNPQWSAATGTFKAMIAANQEAAHAEQEAAQAGEEAARVSAEDVQVDVELGPAQLAAILQVEPDAPAAAPAPPPAPRPPASIGAAPVASEVPSAREPALSGAPPALIRTPPPAPSARAAPEPAALARSAATAAPALRQRPRIEEPQHDEADERTPGMARVLPHLWGAAAAVALVALSAQIVNHYRDVLAATARYNRPLTALYAAIGVQLVPRWDLRAYDVRQLGASVEPSGPGLITVRASIKNAAPQPQPLPLLRVTLQDRFGNRIAARDVAPPFYLPRPTPGSTFLSAGERIDAEMGFVDPGANAVGFEIDACLPTSGGEVTCANDATSR